MSLTADRQPGTPHAADADRHRDEAGFLAELPLLVRWTGRVVMELPQALRFPTEVIRQLAIILRSSSLVIWLVCFVVGGLLAQYSHYVLGQIGAQGYTGLITSIGTIKALLPVAFGFIFSAKVGCGFAAELGSMRVNEEIDALGVIGLPTRQYLVGTRVMATIIALPILYVIGAGISFIGAYVTVVKVFATVSPGGYSSVFWSIITPGDLMVKSMIWICCTCVLTAIVACFYGFNTRGGPVEVGEAAAKSMMVNVVMVTVFGSGLMYQIFYGTATVLPIAN